MNIFSAIGSVIKAANENYREQQKEKERFNMGRDALIQERRSRTLLHTQLEDLLKFMDSNDYHAIIIQIAKECEPFITEAVIGLECELTDLKDGTYLLESREELLE
jgi:hypothetical protein